jgi:hypothetical protein
VWKNDRRAYERRCGHPYRGRDDRGYRGRESLNDDVPERTPRHASVWRGAVFLRVPGTGMVSGAVR